MVPTLYVLQQGRQSMAMRVAIDSATWVAKLSMSYFLIEYFQEKSTVNS